MDHATCSRLLLATHIATSLLPLNARLIPVITELGRLIGPRILAGPYQGFPARTTQRARHSHVDRAHPTTKDPRSVPRGPLATVRSGRIGATAAGRIHVGLESVPARPGAG
jgi:hypothetical protein